MTETQRAAIRRVLEALTNCSSQYGHRCNRCDSEVDEGGRVADALRAALAEPEQEAITDYWHQHYVVNGLLCGLCGNRGVIDARGTTTPAGVSVGGLRYCICPNGQTMRMNKAVMAEAVPEPERTREWHDGLLEGRLRERQYWLAGCCMNTTPPTRRPLTPEQIKEAVLDDPFFGAALMSMMREDVMVGQFREAIVGIVRAAERAHGIGGNDEL